MQNPLAQENDKLPVTFSALRDRCKRESDYIISLLFTNEISLLLTWALLKTRITPNQLTVGSMACGIFGGLLFIKGWFSVGAIFLFLSHVLDCTDGNLARARKQFSQLGRWIDFVGDKTADVALFICVSLYFTRIGDSVTWILLPAVNGLILMLYYYIVDIGLSLGVSPKVQNLTSLKIKGVHVKWGLMEPVIYGFILLPPFGMLKLQLIALFLLIMAGLAYQVSKMIRSLDH